MQVFCDNWWMTVFAHFIESGFKLLASNINKHHVSMKVLKATFQTDGGSRFLSDDGW